MNAASLNLIPAPLQKRNVHRLQLRKWAPIWVLTVTLLAAAQLFLQSRVEDAQAAVADLQQRVRPLQNTSRRINTLESQTANLQAQVSRFLQLEQGRVPSALLRGVATAAVADQVQLDSFRLEDASGPASSAAGAPRTPSKALVLRASAGSDLSVSSFIGRLREQRVFTTVELESSQTNAGGYAAQRSFQLRCQWDALAPAETAGKGAS